MKIKRLYLNLCGFVGVTGLAIGLSTIWLTYTINLTHSLPGHLYVIYRGAPVERGDLLAFRWHGGATYPAGTTFIKIAVGGSGDVVKRVGNAFWVNGRYIGIAKTRSKAGVPLTPAQAGVIPQGQYFVATPSPDSLDSRYALTGNIKQGDVLGKVYAIF